MQTPIETRNQNPGLFLCLFLALTLALMPLHASGQRSTGRMSLASAKKAALARYPGRVIGTPKIVTRSGKQYYDVTVRSGEVWRHVLVHTHTGRLQPTNLASPSRNPRRIALTAYPGKVVAGPTRVKYRGRNVSSVTVQSGMVRRTLLVNAQTGKIVKTMTRRME